MSENLLSPKEIAEKMLYNDAFSQWLGIEIVSVQQDYVKLKMTIRKEMLNGMQKAHGGITFSMADTALAFAANTRGKKAVSIDASINHIEALEEGDLLIAEANLKSIKNKLGFYSIEIKKENTLVALFKGVVYRTENKWTK